MIRKFREALGWSQEYLASIAGTDKRQIQRVEQGEYSPYLRTVTRIAVALGRQPWEVLKVEYQVKVNTDLRPTKKSPGATPYVHKLVETNFFNSPKTVKEVVQECEVRYEISLTSSAVSGALRNLVEQNTLKGLNTEIKGRFRYQKQRKK